MSKRQKKNPNGKVEHQERLASAMSQSQQSDSEANHGISSPKLVNRPKFRGNAPKMRALMYRPNQQRFIDSISHADTKIVVLTGPAGTGKTLLAVRKGLEGVLNGRFADLVLCRPLVEAGGEELGFLPGGVDDKIGPYLEPFYDKLTAFLPESMLKTLLAAKHISAAPLAYMRGRTFSESIVIIDEAQNTSIEQIKMAVTRLGPFSKMIICGDPEQSDIPGGNGLRYLCDLFEKEGAKTTENGCHLCKLGMEDIQRNSVIPYLLDAMSRFQSGARQETGKKSVSAEERIARAMEKAFKYFSRQQGGGDSRTLTRHRNGRAASSRIIQGDLFETLDRNQSVVLNG